MIIDNSFFYTLNKPSLVSFAFTDESKEVINSIKLLRENESFDLYIKAIFTGTSSQYLNYNEPREARYINFCIYETNKSGKGYKVICLFSTHLDLGRMDQESLKIEDKILTIDNSLVPVQGSFEGKKFDEFYNFSKTYLSLKIFYSSYKIDSIEDLDSAFYELDNIVLDTKLPIKMVSENE